MAAFAPIAAARERQEQVAAARAEETATRKAAAAAAKIAERDAWIVAHGSDRLKKGLAAGLIDKMAGAYRSERITVSPQGSPNLQVGEELRPVGVAFLS